MSDNVHSPDPEPVLDCFEEAWNGPTPPRLEDFLPAPGAPGRQRLLIELVRIDWERRLARGEEARLSEYHARFPDLGTDAEAGLALWQQSSSAFRVTLIVTEGPHCGELFSFDGHDTFLVGRAPEAHFSLPEKDPHVSRIHFLVETNPPLCRILDMGSHNGTLLNGRKVQSADLNSGDEIRAGHTVFKVIIDWTGEEERSQTVTGERDTLPPTLDFPIDRAYKQSFPKVPGYYLRQELGRGGMGIVYLAERESDGSRTALRNGGGMTRTWHGVGTLIPPDFAREG